MKSSYNPREEIDELRRTVDELRSKTESQESIIQSLSEMLKKAEKTISMMNNSIERMEAKSRLAMNNQVLNGNQNRRTVGNTLRSISDLTRKNRW